MKNQKIFDNTLFKIRNNQVSNPLDLQRKELNDGDIFLLNESLAKKNLITSLDLSGNHIGNEGATALAKNHSITDLNLCNNELGNEGAATLAQNNSLTSLDLGFNRIADEGAKALAKNHFLTSLNLTYNQVGDMGAKALAQSNSITELNLCDNNIGKEEQKTINPKAIVDDSKSKTIPIHPLSSTLSEKRVQYTVRYTFSPDIEIHQKSLRQLAVSEGDTLTSLEKIAVHVGWLRCQNNKGEQGYVPENFLKKVTLQLGSVPSTRRTSSTSSSVFSSSPVSQFLGSFMINGAPRQTTESQYEVDLLKQLTL